LRRYGFHGLSCEHSVQQLAAARPDLARARIIVAHLGSGTSLTAIQEGRSVATTMGFSTLEGPPMSTRSGSLDPGILLHLLREGMSPATLEDLLYQKSGLRGLSGGTGDMAALLDREATDADAAFAIACYVYRVQREIGSLVAALGGLDVLVFTGGIGEHGATIRERIVGGLQWLGMALDARANEAGAAVITRPSSAILGTVIAADEEVVIARATHALA
jgi:acetate kinase